MFRSLGILGVMIGMLLGSCITPLAIRGFAWSFQDQPGEGPKLAYGAPASDDILLMLTCEPGADRITVVLPNGSPRTGVVLASGGAKARLAGDTVAGPGSGGMIEAPARPQTPPIARFARTGVLTLVDRGRRVRLDAAPHERPAIARFFTACQA